MKFEEKYEIMGDDRKTNDDKKTDATDNNRNNNTNNNTNNNDKNKKMQVQHLTHQMITIETTHLDQVKV